MEDEAAAAATAAEWAAALRRASTPQPDAVARSEGCHPPRLSAVSACRALLDGLAGYVHTHHTTGLTWSSTGADAGEWCTRQA